MLMNWTLTIFLLLHPTDRTRNPTKIFIQHHRTQLRKFSFSNRVAAHWNRLPDHIKNAQSINSFKNQVDDQKWFKYIIRHVQMTSQLFLESFDYLSCFCPNLFFVSLKGQTQGAQSASSAHNLLTVNSFCQFHILMFMFSPFLFHVILFF